MVCIFIVILYICVMGIMFPWMGETDPEYFACPWDGMLEGEARIVTMSSCN
jgi:hypothetical protein